jgi:alkylhydroperoxidase/carboxymuconolactone decarboxylase family protein YurZ
MASEAERGRIREDFRKRRGYWNDDWERLLQINPAYVEGFLNLSAYTYEHGTLSPKTRELVYLATNCSPTHFFERGVRQHGRLAIEYGATLPELIAVAMMVSTVGIQTYLLAAAALEEIMPGAAPGAAPDAAHAAHVATVRARHLAMLGQALPEVECAIRTDPLFYDVWLDFAAVSLAPDSPLSPKDAHLVALAAYAQCTQLSGPGVRQHMRAALANGATPAEVIEVCQLISSMGIHAVVLPVPVLLQEFGQPA